LDLALACGREAVLLVDLLLLLGLLGLALEARLVLPAEPALLVDVRVAVVLVVTQLDLVPFGVVKRLRASRG
jgi:hypothetical protein